jgi:hypothetical protein
MEKKHVKTAILTRSHTGKNKPNLVKPERSISKSRLHETDKSKPKGHNKQTGSKNRDATSKDSKGKSLSSAKNPSKMRKTS